MTFTYIMLFLSIVYNAYLLISNNGYKDDIIRLEQKIKNMENKNDRQRKT